MWLCSFLKIAEHNYDLNTFPHDSRTFVTVRIHYAMQSCQASVKKLVTQTWFV